MNSPRLFRRLAIRWRLFVLTMQRHAAFHAAATSEELRAGYVAGTVPFYRQRQKLLATLDSLKMKTIEAPPDLNRRLGRFYVRRSFLHQHATALLESGTLADFLIVEARYAWDRDAIEYLAISHHFAPVAQECEATRVYSINFKTGPDKNPVLDSVT